MIRRYLGMLMLSSNTELEPLAGAMLVEGSFVKGVQMASGPTSFLRLAGVPFAATDKTVLMLSLLRVSLDQTADIGTITPDFGGESYRYDPLKAKLVSKRQHLGFVYQDGEVSREFSLAQARALSSAS